MPVQALLEFTNGISDTSGNQTWNLGSGTELVDSIQSISGNSLDLNVQSRQWISTSLLNSLTGDFTVEGWFWFSPNSATTDGILRFLNVNGFDFRLYYNYDLLYISVYNNGLLIQTLLTSQNNGWVHIALVRFNGVLTAYVDGFNSDNVQNSDSFTDVELGVGDGASNYLVGYVDSFRIIDEAIYQRSFIPSNQSLAMGYSVFTLDDIVNIGTPIYFNQSIIKPFGAEIYFMNGNGGGGNGGTVVTTPTSTNIVSGNVKKLGVPYSVKITVVSVELNSKVVGVGVSDEITGDYSVDVYPWVDEVLVMASPDYGTKFLPLSVIALGQLVHPTVHNGKVYEVTVAGTLGASEPPWSDAIVTSGSAQLTPKPLYSPLANGFLTPVVTLL